MNLDVHVTKKLMIPFVRSLFHQVPEWCSTPYYLSPFKCALLPSAMSLTHMIMCKNAIAACNDKNVWVQSVVYIFSPSVGPSMATKKLAFSPQLLSPLSPQTVWIVLSNAFFKNSPGWRKKWCTYFTFWHDTILHHEVCSSILPF